MDIWVRSGAWRRRRAGRYIEPAASTVSADGPLSGFASYSETKGSREASGPSRVIAASALSPMHSPSFVSHSAVGDDAVLITSESSEVEGFHRKICPELDDAASSEPSRAIAGAVSWHSGARKTCDQLIGRRLRGCSHSNGGTLFGAQLPRAPPRRCSPDKGRRARS